MRLWSLSPAQLDRAALIACWREALLAQKVLSGGTLGYRSHPQLDRFRALPDPVRGIGTFLEGLADEAARREYRFDRDRILDPAGGAKLTVTEGQLALEWHHLLAKCASRSPEWAECLKSRSPLPHPMMTVVPGPRAPWERAVPPGPA